MPIVKQKNGVTWFSGCGVHSESVGCVAEGREPCMCRYHIKSGAEQFSFEDFASAEEKWISLTGEEKFQLGKSVWN